MPAATIEVRREYTQAQEAALVEALYSAMKLVLMTPAHDKNIRLVVHQPHRFPPRPNHDQPEYTTFISIDAFAGRSLETKRNLYRAIVEHLAPFGIPPDHVTIVLREAPAENWGIRGGQAACDVELGFKVDI